MTKSDDAKFWHEQARWHFDNIGWIWRLTSSKRAVCLELYLALRSYWWSLHPAQLKENDNDDIDT